MYKNEHTKAQKGSLFWAPITSKMNSIQMHHLNLADQQTNVCVSKGGSTLVSIRSVEYLAARLFYRTYLRAPYML